MLVSSTEAPTQAGSSGGDWTTGTRDSELLDSTALAPIPQQPGATGPPMPQPLVLDAAPSARDNSNTRSPPVTRTRRAVGGGVKPGSIRTVPSPGGAVTPTKAAKGTPNSGSVGTSGKASPRAKSPPKGRSGPPKPVGTPGVKRSPRDTITPGTQARRRSSLTRAVGAEASSMGAEASSVGEGVGPLAQGSVFMDMSSDVGSGGADFGFVCVCETASVCVCVCVCVFCVCVCVFLPL